MDLPDRAEAHLWATQAAWHIGTSLDDYLSLLSDAEKHRASQFIFRPDHQEYVIARATLRLVLASYLRCAPDEVHLSAGCHGKPACTNTTELAFNLTHAQGAIVIAATRGQEVGVDIEKVQHLSSVADLARRYFAPGEVEQLFRAEEEDFCVTFLKIWTCKEAYLKALGTGLSQPLDSFELVLNRDASPVLWQGNPDPWSFFHLHPFSSFICALAVRGPTPSLTGGILYSPIL